MHTSGPQDLCLMKIFYKIAIVTNKIEIKFGKFGFRDFTVDMCVNVGYASHAGRYTGMLTVRYLKSRFFIIFFFFRYKKYKTRPKMILLFLALVDMLFARRERERTKEG